MELKAVRLEIPEGGNLILGQTHFIKTVEDRKLVNCSHLLITHVSSAILDYP